MRWVVALALLFLASAAQAQVSPVPPIIAGTLDLGTGTTVNAGQLSVTASSNGLTLQVTQSFDPSTDSIGARNIMFSTTLSPSVTTTNTVENANSFVYINGPGAQNGEINTFHAYDQINVGASVAAMEGYESSMDNYAAISSYFYNYLALSTNQSTGTAAAINGVSLKLVNSNTASGALGIYAGIDMETMTGGGSLPSAYYFLRAADPNASSNLMGGLAIGSLSPQASGSLLVAAGTTALQGPDTAAGTFALLVKSQTSPMFSINDAAEAEFYPGSSVAVTQGTMEITGPDNTSSQYPFVVKSLAGTNLFYLDDAGGIHTTSGQGQTCTGTPTASYATVNGIVTHC